MDDVFIGSEALAAGTLSRGQLRWNYRALLPDVYVHKNATPSLSLRTIGAWLWSRRQGVIAGLPVTTTERTALDLARHSPRDTAIPHLDALAHATGLTAPHVLPLVDRYRGGRELRTSIDTLGLIDGGSHTPRESLIRLALIDAGFPNPRTRFTVTDGTNLALIAMGYVAPKVGVEFGISTPGFLLGAGWTMISAARVLNPKIIAYLVRAAVIERGYPLSRLLRLSRG